MLPSGIVLQKLFDTIDRDIFETTFLESVKCYPLMRKNIGSILYSLTSYILPTTSENLLNLKLSKFLVGNSPNVIFPNDSTVFLGKDNDIVLVGEAPANNGWRM